MEILPGESIKFECNYPLNIKWFHNGKHLPQNVQIINNNTLLVHKVNILNEGYYECEGLKPSEEKNRYSRAKLTIAGNLFNQIRNNSHSVQ